jgi:hypothetical protein
MIERIYISKSVQMFIEVGLQNKKIYEQEFETQLIQQTRDYYRNESNRVITENSCNAYILKANKRYLEEQDRVNSYLHQSSMDKILLEFLREYIENHGITLLNMEGSGLTQMIQQDQFNEIKMMFSLFKKCPASLDQFKFHLKNYIVLEGQKLVRNDSIANDELVRKIIQFRERMVALLTKSLDKDMTIDMCIKTSFENFINENEKTA